jgi:hypothetical protein
MKRLLFILAFISSLSLFAQKNYTIDGQSYSLETAVEGTLTLLWTTLDGEYRYFSQKGSDIVELKNTKSNRSYQEEYKQVLQSQTADQSISLDKVNLTLASLKRFFHTYNKQVDPSYAGDSEPVQLEARLGFFGGMTNYPYFANPDNSLLPQVGADLEVIDNAKLKRHSLVLQFRQLFATSDFDLSSSQLSINYRFKFVQTEVVDVFINTKIAQYVHLTQNIPDPDGDGETNDSISGSGGEFQAPFAFGLGADIPLGKGFITVAYYDFLALNLNDTGDFPIDFVVGYKFNL